MSRTYSSCKQVRNGRERGSYRGELGMRNYVGIPKSFEDEREHVIGARSHECKKVTIQYLTIENSLRPLQDDAFVQIEKSVATKTVKIQKRQNETEERSRC